MKIITTLCVSVFVLCTSVVFASSQEADQKFQGFNLQGYDETGEKSWEVNGDTADIIGTKVKLSNVDANTFGEKKVNLTAETGVIDQASGDMHLENDVIITSEDGSQLITDSLDWKRNDDLVTTDDDVLITDEKFTLTGTGMEGHPELKNTKIHEDVKVKINTEKEGAPKRFVTITSDGPMIVDQVKSIATFQDNVVAVEEGRTLEADRMELYFNEELSDIREIICIGNVVITQGENRTYAERATYNATTQKLILSGRPKLIILTEGDNAFTTVGD